MISISHWGMFAVPAPGLIMPALLPEEMVQFEEEMKRPSYITWTKDVMPQWVEPIQF